MSHIHIVLHEPEIPQNTGNIARTCAVTGASLHLIRPLGFEVDDKHLKRAGLDYWHQLDIHYYDSLDDFFIQHQDVNFYCFTTKSQQRFTDVTYPEEVYLFFGKESKGLPEDFLVKHPKNCVRIPMRPTLRSLNLSNSVAIAVYEVLRQSDFEGLQIAGDLTKFCWETGEAK